MMSNDVSFLDFEQLGQLLDAELVAFEDHYLEEITEQQDLRALLLAWFALFLPEAFSDGLVARMSEFRFAASKEADYKYHGWYRLLPLDIALFAMEGSISHIQNHRCNFDHHKRSIRSVVVRTLALVAHQLPFGDEELLSRCATNLRVLHGGCEWAAIVALLGQGPPDAKRVVLETWLRAYELNRDERQLLEHLLVNEYTPNSYLGSYLAWITRYVALRLMSFKATQPLPSEPAPSLPGRWNLSPDTLWKRMAEHPLSGSLIEINFHTENPEERRL